MSDIDWMVHWSQKIQFLMGLHQPNRYDSPPNTHYRYPRNPLVRITCRILLDSNRLKMIAKRNFWLRITPWNDNEIAIEATLRVRKVFNQGLCVRPGGRLLQRTSTGSTHAVWKHSCCSLGASAMFTNTVHTLATSTMTTAARFLESVTTRVVFSPLLSKKLQLLTQKYCLPGTAPYPISHTHQPNRAIPHATPPPLPKSRNLPSKRQ
jgi:hypothetical protein